MNKVIVFCLVLVLLASSVSAADFGLRGGLTLSPDQVHIGGHMDMGQVLPPMRLVPNVEIGFGNDVTMICFNGDLIYDFADSPFGIGGELGLNYADVSGAGSNTDLGLSILGDYRMGLSNSHTLLLEAKIGVLDSPDFKITVGYSL